MSDHEKAKEILETAHADSCHRHTDYLLARICAALERLVDIEETSVEVEVASLDGPPDKPDLCRHRLSPEACVICSREG